MTEEALIEGDTDVCIQKLVVGSQQHEERKTNPAGGVNRLILTAIMTSMGSALSIGHNLGVINNAQQVIRDWIRTTAVLEYGVTLTPHMDLLVWSLAVSLFVVGAIIGSLLAGTVADRVGRRLGLLLTHLLQLFSAAMFMICSSVQILELLMFGRLFSGIAAGIGTGLVPLYLSEICTPSLKGVMGAMLPMGITIGVLGGQIFGTSSLMGTDTLWPFLVGGYLVYTSISLLLHPFSPESPTYLALVKKNYGKAKKELMRLRNGDEMAVERELFEFKKSCSNSEKGTNWTVLSLIRSTTLRKPVICVMVLNAAQQLVGINAVFYYSTLVFNNAGLSLQESQLASLCCGIINVFMSLCALVLIKYFRRKLLLMVSISLYILFQVILIISLKYLKVSPAVPYIAMVAINGTVLAYGFGLGPVPYMIGTEIFPDGPRGVGLSLGAMSNYTCNLIIGFCFPLIEKQLKEASFGIFIAISFLFGIFVVLYLPETYKTVEKRKILPSELDQI